MKKFALLLAFVSLAACSSGGPAVITGVSVGTEPSTVKPGGRSILIAYVTGSGSFSLDANWQIVSGGGSLSTTSGRFAEYIAPATPTVAVIRATTKGVAPMSQDVTVTVTPDAPDAGR